MFSILSFHSHKKAPNEYNRLLFCQAANLVKYKNQLMSVNRFMERFVEYTF